MTSSSDDAARWFDSSRESGEAFEKFFSAYRNDLKRMVAFRLDKRLSRRIDPSDIVQETQLEAYRRLVQQRGPVTGSVRVWLRGIALERVYNAHRDHIRAELRSVEREISIPDDSSVALGMQLLADDSPPIERLSREELAALVRRAVEKLKPEDHEVIVLRVFDGLTNAESAEVLGIKPDAASKRFGRAWLRLQSLLRESGLDGSL